MFIGRELAYHPEYSLMQRVYIRLLGVPIVGLRIRARNIFPLIPANRSYREILDAGCGLGVLSFGLARRYPQANVLGIDLIASMVQSAEHIRNKAEISNVRFQVADIASMNGERQFDLAVCVDILEHIEDDDAALQALFLSLRKGGVLVVHVPTLYRRYPVWKKSLNFDVETHVRPGYELQHIFEKVQRAGFSILEKGYTYGFLETLANNVSYMITRARMQNKNLYALAFPFLNALSWFGARPRPKSLAPGFMWLQRRQSPMIDEKKDAIEDREILKRIADFWSAQLNNEIFLRKHANVMRGSREYFEIILAARRKYIYYLPRMVEFLETVPVKTLLEVGCGMGTDTLVFESKGFQVTGIDLAPAHLQLATRLFEHYGAKGSFVEANAERLPFPNETFGGVYSFGVLHHTPNTHLGIQ